MRLVLAIDLQPHPDEGFESCGISAPPLFINFIESDFDVDPAHPTNPINVGRCSEATDFNSEDHL